jgi:hypothetical protein
MLEELVERILVNLYYANKEIEPCIVRKSVPVRCCSVQPLGDQTFRQRNGTAYEIHD